MPRGGESDFDRANRLELEAINANIQQTASVPRMHRPHSRNANSFQQQEQFLRSASARLPRKDEDSVGTGNRDGERKREESMKRLLEWKQRMLQSPLTRKGVPISIAMDASKSPIVGGNMQPSASQMMMMAQQQQGVGGVQRSRSETHANAGYNSYSSDDEGIYKLKILFIYIFFVKMFRVRNCSSLDPTVITHIIRPFAAFFSFVALRAFACFLC